MSSKERHRLELLSRVKSNEMTLHKASELCGLCYRQMKRVWKRYCLYGDAGLVHRGRGRASNRRKEAWFRQKVIKRYQERYPDFGPTLASEHLAKEDLVVHPETLRRWLLSAGLWKKVRKRRKHRQWRERREHVGELVQMDGSHHDWFEKRRGRAVLMVMIDDATNRTMARFYEGEGTKEAMDLFKRYTRLYGLPQALYVDHDSIYECSRQARIDEELRGEGPQTQFSRAMKTLDVRIIFANSSQAKGRVERRHGVFQDRLIKAMRLEGISTIEAANQYLDKTFLPEMNRRFVCAARQNTDLHRQLPACLQLKDILCFEEPRSVQNDWTVRWRNRYFQIDRQHQSLNLAKRKITVRERLDGSVVLLYRDKPLCWKELPQRPPARIEKSQPKSQRKTQPRIPYKPPADHPWRKLVSHAWLQRPPPTSNISPFSGGAEPSCVSQKVNQH